MATDNKARFSRVIVTLAEVYGRALTPEVIAVYWSVFSKYPMDQIEAAARRHVEKAKFFPTPAELLGHIPAAASCQHIGADEAWCLALESMDEVETVLVTSEILMALDTAKDIYLDGDKIGARMAFRGAYERILATVSTEPVWFISAGSDSAKRADAIERAVMAGRISAGSCREYLLGTDRPVATVVGLIEHAAEKSQSSSDAEFRRQALRNVGALKAMLAMGDDGGIARREEERKDFDKHKQQELSRVASALGSMN
jgi:hypothetical protein